MTPRPTISIRQLIFPIMIIVIAAVFWVVGTRGQSQDLDRVRLFVRQLCMDVEAGRSIDGRLQHSNAYVRAHLPEALEQIIQPPLDEQLTELRIDVEPGDHPMRGNGDANCHVMISIKDVEMLGLRMRVAERVPQFEIIGFWRP